MNIAERKTLLTPNDDDEDDNGLPDDVFAIPA
jgi:hypothetical protein